MGLREEIQDDMKQAMRNRNQLELNTVRGVISEWKNFEINSKQPATDDKVIAIIQKEVKKRRDAIGDAEKAGRPELVSQNEQEIQILQKYLRDMMSEEKLSEVISGLIAGGAGNIGAIMGALTKNYAGKYDGGVANMIAKRLLENRP